MAKYQDVFKRYEKKYILNDKQYNNLRDKLKGHMKEDDHGIHTINNIYYDTDSYELIRASIEKPMYKEKLRVRSYSTPKADDKVFVEIKKKYDGVVYKRRSKLGLKEAENFLISKKYPEKSSQINDEILWFLNMYNPVPKVFIAYERLALFSIEDSNVRITFDKNIRFRDYCLDLSKGSYGTNILEPEKTLMEIKIPGVFPLWLSDILSELEIFPASFSKYGNCYKQFLINKFHNNKGDVKYA